MSKINENSLFVGSNEISKDTDIGAFCLIENSHFLGNVSIGEYTMIKNSTIDDVIIGKHCTIINSIIEKGTIIHDYCNIVNSKLKKNIEVFDYTMIKSNDNSIIEIGEMSIIENHQKIGSSLKNNSYVQTHESFIFLCE